jgi:hypothetical protein
MEERIETNERQLKASIEIEEGIHRATDSPRTSSSSSAGPWRVPSTCKLLALKQKMGMLPAGSPEKKRSAPARRMKRRFNAEVEDVTSEKK